MNAIETLEYEHQWILRVLDALELFCVRVEKGEPCDSERVALFVQFFGGYTDALHHAKEEILFELLREHGAPGSEEAMANLDADHELGRLQTSAMQEAAGPGILEPARAYIDMLRLHIAREDRLFYPWVRDHLAAGARDELDRRCQEVDQAFVASGRTSELARTTARLLQRDEPAR